ncbi:MAG: hypothetical protein R2699_12480 [Acidimicrobiales bacterium]
MHLWKPGDRPGTVQALQWLGIPALALILVMTVTVERTDSWLYRGRLPAYRLLSCLLIVSISVPGRAGGRSWLLSFRALARSACSATAATCSTGLFFDVHPRAHGALRRAALGLVAVRLPVRLTMGLAYVSNRFFEHPIRIGERLTGRTPWIVAPASLSALVVVGFVLVTLNPPPPEGRTWAATARVRWRPMPAAEEGWPRT